MKKKLRGDITNALQQLEENCGQVLLTFFGLSPNRKFLPAAVIFSFAFGACYVT